MTDGGSGILRPGRPAPQAYCSCQKSCSSVRSAAGHSWVEVALYGQRKLGFLRRFFPLHGVPSHDQLGNVFARL